MMKVCRTVAATTPENQCWHLQAAIALPGRSPHQLNRLFLMQVNKNVSTALVDQVSKPSGLVIQASTLAMRTLHSSLVVSLSYDLLVGVLTARGVWWATYDTFKLGPGFQHAHAAAFYLQAGSGYTGWIN